MIPEIFLNNTGSQFVLFFEVDTCCLQCLPLYFSVNIYTLYQNTSFNFRFEHMLRN